MNWARILAFVTGRVDKELLARSEYLVAENRILKGQLKGRLKLSDAERAALAEIGHRLGRKVLAEVANVARPDTILAWYRKLIARKFDGSKARRSPGRPRIKREVEQLIVRMAKENRDWGYDRIAGALANLGYKVCDQTVGNVLQRHALPPAPERKRTTTWPAFIRTHLALLAGSDFLTAEVLTLRGLVTHYVLFFIHLESRRVDIAGITVHPDERWMQQMARNVTMEGCGALRDCRYLLHDRDTKYTQSFPSDHCIRPGRPAHAFRAQPEPECLCGALGQVGEGGVPVQGDPLWRALAAASPERVCRTFPCRTESSGEGQRAAVPSGYEHPPRQVCSMPRATGRTLALLPSGGSVNGGGASDEFFDLTASISPKCSAEDA
jgi:putative transposase